MTLPAALLDAVAHGLPRDASLTQLDAAHLDAPAIDAASYHRVLGVLTEAVRDGRVRATPAVVEELLARHREALLTCLAAEETALLAIDTLTAAGVDHRVLKGPAVAHLDESDPARRHFGDADVLVPRRALPLALRALRSAGFARIEPALRRGWERRFAKSVVLRAPNGGELDLHLTLTDGWYGAVVDLDGVWAAPPSEFALGGTTVRALPPQGRLVHAAYHTALGAHAGLRTVRDVALLTTASGATWQAGVDLATRWRSTQVLAAAVRTAWATLHLDPGHPAIRWAAEMTPSDEDRRRLAAYARDDGFAWANIARTTLPALDRLDRLRYIVGVAVPSAASLRHRGRTRVAHTVAMARWPSARRAAGRR